MLNAYGLKSLHFGPDYIIPKPFDPRAIFWVTPAIVEAAIHTGVARKQITDMNGYRTKLERLMMI